MTTTIRKLKAKTIENPYYRELLSVKIGTLTKIGMDKAAKNGQAISKSAYGYYISESKHLVVNEKEAEIVKLIYSLSERGYMVREIVQKLKDLRILTPIEQRKGVKNSTCNWSLSTVYQILKNKVYIGIYTYGVKGKSGDVIELIDNHASIITQEQFDNVQNNFKVNNTKICK